MPSPFLRDLTTVCVALGVKKKKMSKKRLKVWLHSIRLDAHSARDEIYAKKGHCCQDKFDKTLERAWNKLKSRKLLSVQPKEERTAAYRYRASFKTSTIPDYLRRRYDECNFSR